MAGQAPALGAPGRTGTTLTPGQGDTRTARELTAGRSGTARRGLEPIIEEALDECDGHR
jgi:hypothetical protein